ncbi:MAG: nitroreductase family protein [Sedimentisphaerales bacterium]|nr:nitroreductase family protein [Sedimentisphaerales bacterium]
MNVQEAIRSRYSCRAYQDKAIEQDKLETIFEAARLAPSAKNLQDWRFVVVKDKTKKKQLAEAAGGQNFIDQAGAVIVACSNTDYILSCGQPAGPIDVAIALEHIALQAAELGLATCWVGSFNAEKVKALLGIPDGVTVVELMAIGYPADKTKEPKREPIEKILCYDKWQF